MTRGRLSQWLSILLIMVLLVPAVPALAAGNTAAAGNGMPFPDLPEGHPARAHVLFLAERNLISGYPDGRFGPSDPLTRAAATKLAAQVAGLPALQTGSASGFADLGDSHWSLPWVRAGVSAKLVQGYADGTFQPDGVLTRAQLAALAVRATRQPTDKLPAVTLTDVAAADWFHAHATLAVATGMMDAPEGKFRPNDTATRAEAARAFAQAFMFTPAAYSADLPFRVQPEGGLVEVAAPGSTEFTQITEPALVPVGGQVRTAGASTAFVTFPDGSTLQVEPESQVRLHRARGNAMVTGTAVEDLEVELISGNLLVDLIPRKDRPDTSGDTLDLTRFSDEEADAQAIRDLFIKADAAAAAQTRSVEGLQLNSDRGSLTPGSSDTEVTITLVNGDGQPVTATAPVPVQLFTDLGHLAAQSVVIAQGESSARVKLTAPSVEPADGKVRLIAVAGGTQASLVLPTSHLNWWDAPHYKRVRARIRMPWSTASIRGTVTQFSVSATGNSACNLEGQTSLKSANGQGTTVGSGQCATVSDPAAAPSSASAMTPKQSTQVYNSYAYSNTGKTSGSSGGSSSSRGSTAIFIPAPSVDTTAPLIRISSHSNRQELGLRTITLSGSTVDGSGVRYFHVNNTAIPVKFVGGSWASWSAPITLNPGENRIEVSAKDAAGNVARQSITLIFKDTLPAVTLDAPATTKESRITLTGQVTSIQGNRSLRVNGRSVGVGANGTFSTTVDLKAGLNRVTAELTDAMNRTVSATADITLANQPPLLSVEEGPAETNQINYVLRGRAVAQHNELQSVEVNGSSVLFDAEGNFTAVVKLTAAENTITVKATDRAGNAAVSTRKVKLSNEAPQITILTPRDRAAFNSATQLLQGVVKPIGGVASLKVNGEDLKFWGEHQFFIADVNLVEGENRFTVEAVGPLGATSTATVTAYLITTPPYLSINIPDGFVAAEPKLALHGTASAKYGPLASLSVNGAKVAVDAFGNWEANVQLKSGDNAITVEASDTAGNVTTITRTVKFNPAATITLAEPGNGAFSATSAISVSGEAGGGAEEVLVNGSSVTTRANGAFAATVDLVPGENTVDIALPESAGGGAISRQVFYLHQPPSLEVNGPEGTVALPIVTFSGTALDSIGMPTDVTVVGPQGAIPATSPFSVPVQLSPGVETSIAITARDGAGQTTTITRTLTYLPALPQITILSPANEEATKDATVKVTGTAASDIKITGVSVNGVNATADAKGNFSASVPLQYGWNTLSVTATDETNRSSSNSVRVLRQGDPPTIAITGPMEGFVSGEATVKITGTASTTAGKVESVTVNGVPASVSASGSWSTEVTLQPGENLLAAEVRDTGEGVTRATRKVVYAAGAPTITFTSPAPGAEVNKTTATIKGQVSTSVTLRTLSINGNRVTPDARGNFTLTVYNLKPGENTITAEATDALGREGSASLTFKVTYQPPQIHLTAPASVETEEVTISGSVVVASGYAVRQVYVAGKSVTVDQSGAFSATVKLTKAGENTVAVTANDGTQTSKAEVMINFTPTPPELSISSPADQSTATSSSVTVTGQAKSKYGAVTVTVNGRSATVKDDGSFSTSASLVASGAQSITVTAKDKFGTTTTQSVTVTYGAPAPVVRPPTVSITAPAAGEELVQGPVTISGTYSASSGLKSITLNGAPIAGANGQFSAKFDQVQLGANTVTVEVTDQQGRKATAEASFTFHPQPTLRLTNLEDGMTTSDETITLTGTYTAPMGLQTLTVNGQPATAENGTFTSQQITLAKGANTIQIVATDALNRTVEVSRTLTFAPESPSLRISSPSVDTTVTAQVLLAGNVSSRYGNVTLTINDEVITVAENGDFSSERTLELRKETTFTFVVKDRFENQVTATRTITFDPSKPSLAIASPEQNSVFTDRVITVSGTYQAEAGLKSLTVNGANATVDGNSFSATLTLPVGTSEIPVILTDTADQTSTATVTVEYAPNPSATNSTLSSDLRFIHADGIATAKASLQLKDKYGSNLKKGGHTVQFQSSDPDVVIGPVVYEGDGLYTVRLTSLDPEARTTIRAAVAEFVEGAEASVALPHQLSFVDPVITKIWQGGTNDNWLTADNWIDIVGNATSAEIPKATDGVLIPAGTTRNPLLTFKTAVSHLFVEGVLGLSASGVELSVSGTVKTPHALLANGNEPVWGLGRIILTGVAASFEGRAPNLSVSGNSRLTGDAVIAGEVFLADGMTLDLDRFTLTLRGDLRSYSITAKLDMSDPLSTLRFAGETGPQKIQATGITLGNVIFDNSQYVMFQANATISGTATILRGEVTASTIYDVTIAADLVDQGAVVGGWKVGDTIFTKLGAQIPSKMTTNATFVGSVTLPANFNPGGTLTMTGGGEINAGLMIPVGSTLKLSGPTKLLGDVLLDGGVLLSGSGANLDLNGHSLNVTESFTIERSAVLIMQHANDHLTVMKDLQHSGENQTGLLTAGVIDLGGDLTVGSNYPTPFRVDVDPAQGVTGTLIRFMGTAKQQKVTLSNSGLGATQSQLGRIEVNNPFGVHFAYATVIVGKVTILQGKVTSPSALWSIQLADDLEDNVGGAWQAVATTFLKATPLFPTVMVTNATFASNASLPSGFTLTGNLTLQGDTSLNGPATINGNLTVTGLDGSLNVSGQSLTVTGYLRTEMQSPLIMQNENDYVLVLGNLELGGAGPAGSLSAGSLEVKGDVRAFRNAAWAWPKDTSPLNSSGTHKLILSGTVRQRLYLHTDGGNIYAAHVIFRGSGGALFETTAKLGTLTIEASSGLVYSGTNAIYRTTLDDPENKFTSGRP